jgi:uncharacterized protein YaiE (UPF0345 family)
MKFFILLVALIPGMATAGIVVDITHFNDNYSNTGLYDIGYDKEVKGYTFSLGAFEYKTDTYDDNHTTMHGQFVGIHRRFSDVLSVKAQVYLNQSGHDFGNITMSGAASNGFTHEESCERDFADIHSDTYFQGCSVSAGITKSKTYGILSIGRYDFNDNNYRDVISARLGYNLDDNNSVEVFRKQSQDSIPSPSYFSPYDYNSTRLMARHLFHPTKNMTVKVGAGGGTEHINGIHSPVKYMDAVARYDHHNLSMFLKVEKKWASNYSYNYGSATLSFNF